MTTLDNPIRLEIQKRMSALLGSISTDNGYKTDLNGQVYRGRMFFGDETPLPSLSILEPPIPMDQLPPPSTSPSQSGPWELIIQGFIKDDRENPTDPAHVLMADVKRCLAAERQKANWDRPEEGIFGLGRHVLNLYIGTGVVRPPDDVSAVAYFWVSIMLDLSENIAEPYNAE